jgi:hypothetical protein
MSFIGKIERPASLDYIGRLIAKTAREDATLLAACGYCRARDEDSAELLRALADIWPITTFDELNIATKAPGNTRLLRALAFLGPQVRRFGGGPMLARGNVRDITRWLLMVAGREIGGLRLRRDAIGWCEIVGGRQ